MEEYFWKSSGQRFGVVLRILIFEIGTLGIFLKILRAIRQVEISWTYQRNIDVKRWSGKELERKGNVDLKGHVRSNEY